MPSAVTDVHVAFDFAPAPGQVEAEKARFGVGVEFPMVCGSLGIGSDENIEPRSTVDFDPTFHGEGQGAERVLSLHDEASTEGFSKGRVEGGNSGGGGAWRG